PQIAVVGQSPARDNLKRTSATRRRAIGKDASCRLHAEVRSERRVLWPICKEVGHRGRRALPWSMPDFRNCRRRWQTGKMAELEVSLAVRPQALSLDCS